MIIHTAKKILELSQLWRKSFVLIGRPDGNNAIKVCATGVVWCELISFCLGQGAVAV